MHGDGTNSAAGLRLGDITYSNCFPVHARLLDDPRPTDPGLVRGVPSHLNRLLKEGAIDVAPSSSIEFARNSDRYRILPDLVIGSRGPVRSILFRSHVHPTKLEGQRVALPSASATSVVLLKILLHRHWQVTPQYFWFDQSQDDPFAQGAKAALYIGDVALRLEDDRTMPFRFDLGEVWYQATGLPFAFAVWQASGGSSHALEELQALLIESRQYFDEHQTRLAADFSGHYDLPGPLLDDYWGGLTYVLDEEMVEGLRTYYRFAAELGELPGEPQLRWTQPSQKLK